MSKFTRIITTEGDRWDLVAERAYGDATKMSAIIRANTHVPLAVEIPTGTELAIPVIDRPKQDNSLLPPWRK